MEEKKQININNIYTEVLTILTGLLVEPKTVIIYVPSQVLIYIRLR